MNTAFNLVDFDDGPTLVMAQSPIHTEVMDRRRIVPEWSPPASGVMPIARPIEAQPISYPPRASADATQPALRVRRDLQGSRRTVVALAIGFAFVFGIAASFGTQVFMANTGAPSPALASRAPRTLTDRSSSLDTRSTPDALPHTTDDGVTATSVKSTKPKRKTSPTATSSSEAEPASTAPAAAPTEDTTPAESLDGRDLLGEGLGAAP